jgi:hypothetical protein
MAVRERDDGKGVSIFGNGHVTPLSWGGNWLLVFSLSVL